MNPLTGDADFGPWPSTRITECATLQLRLEAYNAFNHANFGVNVSSAFIADCANASCALGAVSGSYNGNRNVQLGAKLVF